MQTFAPLDDLDLCARAMLYYRRLRKQRSEAKQVYLALTIPSYELRHHPIVRSWEGHRGFLCLYGIAVCSEWRRRGYRDSLLPWFVEAALGLPVSEFEPPPWWGSEEVHGHYRVLLGHKEGCGLPVPDCVPSVKPWHSGVYHSQPRALPFAA